MDKMSAWDKVNLIRSFNDGIMKAGEKSILLIIASHLGENDFAWLSLTTIANESCMHRTNVNINIKKLISRRYIQKLSPSHGYKSCRFVVNFDVIKSASCKTLLVAKHYLTSSETLPPQQRNTTSVVAKRYPNRKIKEKEKKDKRKGGVNTTEKQTNERMSLVKEWAPGNPDYDRFHND